MTTFALSCFGLEEYVNPVDGKTYVADWKTYTPKGKIVKKEGRVKNGGIRLLNTQDEFEVNTTVDDLVKMIGYIEDSLRDVVGTTDGIGEIYLQISLNHDKNPEFKMSYSGELSKLILQKFYDRLGHIDVISKKETVKLQIHLIVEKNV